MPGRVDRHAELVEQALVRNDLGGVPVVGGDQDQGIGVLLGKRQGAIQGLVELLEFSDGPTGISRVGLLVDGG